MARSIGERGAAWGSHHPYGAAGVGMLLFGGGLGYALVRLVQVAPKLAPNELVVACAAGMVLLGLVLLSGRAIVAAAGTLRRFCTSAFGYAVGLIILLVITGGGKPAGTTARTLLVAGNVFLAGLCLVMFGFLAWGTKQRRGLAGAASGAPPTAGWRSGSSESGSGREQWRRPGVRDVSAAFGQPAMRTVPGSLVRHFAQKVVVPVLVVVVIAYVVADVSPAAGLATAAAFVLLMAAYRRGGRR